MSVYGNKNTGRGREVWNGQRGSGVRSGIKTITSKDFFGKSYDNDKPSLSFDIGDVYGSEAIEKLYHTLNAWI